LNKNRLIAYAFLGVILGVLIIQGLDALYPLQGALTQEKAYKIERAVEREITASSPTPIPSPPPKILEEKREAVVDRGEPEKSLPPTEMTIERVESISLIDAAWILLPALAVSLSLFFYLKTRYP
jgi:hypothetical protein